MTRIDEDALSLHPEVALTGAAPVLLDDLTNLDRNHLIAAATMLRGISSNVSVASI